MDSTQQRSRFGEPTSWDVLNDIAKHAIILLTLTEPRSDPKISAGATEKLPCSETPNISTWSYDVEGHVKKCVKQSCDLANKTTAQLYKVSTPCIDNHQFREEELKSEGGLSDVCPQIVLKCLYLTGIGGPNILWSVNKLARAITKWTRACDKRSARLISHIHRRSEYKQFCHVGNTAQ